MRNRNTRRLKVVGAIALLMLFANGCIEVESKHPLDDVSKAQPDDRLVGTWVTGKKDEKTTWQISSAGSGFPAGVYVLRETTEESEFVGYLFVIKIKDQHFINLADTDSQPLARWDASKISFYSIFGYEFRDGQLYAKPMELETFSKAIKRKAIAGTIEVFSTVPPIDSEKGAKPRSSAKASDNEDIRLTDSPANLRRFFASNLDKLFLSQEIKLQKRIKRPENAK